MPTSPARSEPIIVQGGMGVAVSAWQLARAVSRAGQLGIVSGTAIDTVLARRLQLGDPGGHMRRALDEFPFPAMARRILDRYFVPDGKPFDASLATTSALPANPTQEQLELVVAANFVEVFLAKEGHDGLVGINYLEKIQTPTLPSLYGAMLARVDYVFMGAGIPRAIPGVLDRLVEGAPVELPLNILGAQAGDEFVARFDPLQFAGGKIPWLERPKFVAIVASATLASMLARKATGRVDGFVVEGPTAGGHNAPPRGASHVNERGEPVYGDRDIVDLDIIRSLEIPFWLAGSHGSPDRVVAALEAGAAGVQVGTAFAFCEESGLTQDIKDSVFQICRDGEPDVVTDPVASPTGFPFKVLQLEGSLSDEVVYDERTRVCDLGFLRQGYRTPKGTIGWRCPGEAVSSYLRKGGDLDDTCGRKCLCNALLANVGLGQRRRDGQHERPLVTCGDDLQHIVQFLGTSDATSYSAADVVEFLLSGVAAHALTH